MHQNNATRALTLGAVIAALYVALTYLASLLGLSSGVIQVRLSEALCVLPIFLPAAIPGLAVGCLLANGIGVAMGVNSMPMDILFGTLATLLASMCSYFVRNVRFRKIPLWSFFPPVLWNGLIVGWELWWFLRLPFWISAFFVAAGELAVCAVLGGGLYALIIKTRLYRLFSAD